MKLLRLLLLFILVSSVGISAFGQSTCQEVGTATGTDDSGVNVSMSSFPCTVGGAITAMTLTTTNSSTYCGSWYDYTASVTHSGGTETITICNLTAQNLATFNGATIDLNTITNVTVAAVEIDGYSDQVTINVQVDITYTPPACASPTGLTASSITATTATVEWLAAVGATAYNWEVVPLGNGQGVGVVSNGSGAGLTGSATGLSDNTDYDLYVQTDCGGSGTSSWVGPFNFATPCVAVTAFPFIESFESITTGIPLCWTNDGTISASYNWSSFATGYTGRGVRLNSYNALNGDIGELMTQTLDLSGLTTAEFKFQYKNPTGGNFEVLISTNGGTTYTSLETGLTGQTAWVEKTYDITAYIGSNVIIQFKGTSNYGSGDAYIYLDDVKVREIPTCLDPSTLAATSVTATTATLGWTSGGSGESAWDIELGATGFTPTATATEAGVTNTYIYSSLTPSTTYDYYVRADCGGGDHSAWVGPYTFTTACANETAPYTESFDASISTCWSQSAAQGGPWAYGASFWNSNCATPSDHTGNAGSFIALDHSTPDEAVVIEMVTVDVTALTTPYLKFYHYTCASGPTTPNQLYVEAWDGSTWNNVATITTGSASWEEYGYMLTSHVYNGSLVKIRFRAEPGTGDVYLADQAMDDISVIEAPNCPNPSAMTASPIAGTTADLAWTAGSTETAWNLEWKAGADFTPGTMAADASASPTTTPAYSMTGLTAVTTYYVYYQADCGGDESDWIGPYSFTTTILCPVPSGMGITGTTATTGSVAWTAGATETTWDLEWKAGANFTPGTGAEDDAATHSGSPAYTITGLTPETTYYVQYRANCGGGNGESNWVYAGTITTPCAAIAAFPSTTDMTSNVPTACWAEAGAGEVADGPSGTSSDWGSGYSYVNSGGSTVNTNKINLFSSVDREWLLSPQYDLSGGGPYQLIIEVAVTEYNNSTADAAGMTGTDDEVKLLMSTDNGANWSTLTTWNAANQPSVNGTEYKADLTAQSGTVEFAIWASDGSSDDSPDYDFHVGVFTVEAIPSCDKPLSLTSGTITTTSATLGWTEDGSATAWDLKVQAAGTGTPITFGTAVASTSENITSLTANTAYEFYVRAVCGVGDTSEWVGPHAFTTLCNTVTEISENFDGVTTPNLPDCWGIILDNGAVSSATITSSTSADNSAPNGIDMYNWNSPATANHILVLPVVSNLSAGTHRLRFYARNTTATQDLEVGTLSDPNDGATFTSLQSVDINTLYTEYVVDFTGYSGSDQYIAIRRLSTSTFTRVYIDDVFWEAVPTVPNCSVLSSPADAATDISITTNLSWAANIDATGYKLSIGTTMGGTDILNASDLGNVTSYDPPTDLDFNTTYYVTLIAYNGNGDATSCSETTFTTNDGCAIPSSPTNGSTTASTSPTISWSSITGATGYMISIGTTAGGTDILAPFDNGTATSYAASGLNYVTQYFVSIKAYNANGTTSAACNTYEFTTGANPNYGGGPDGTDPNQMTSGGYYFANSLAGAGASMTQPSYSWIDPVAAGHTEITTWTDDGATGGDDSYFTIPDIGFDFSFYGNTYRTNNSYVNSNGALHFGTSYSSTGASSSIPVAGTPNNMIAACLMDLDDITNGKVYYGGDANQFVVTWWQYSDYSGSVEYITVQVILYADGKIVIQYNDAESTADEGSEMLADALVGIENADGTKGIQYRNNGSGGPMFGSPMALAFNTMESALPVEMTSFTAQAEGTANVLAWETATEENNAYFDVERSADGVNFETIGQVEGNGTTLEVSNYNFVDEAPATVSYYRLRQIDFDGNFAYSDIRIVKRENAVNNSATFYPVPVTDRLTIDFEATTNEDLNITVTDALGRQVITKVVRTVAGENQFTVDFDTLPMGTYFIKLQSNNANVIRTIIKR